MSSLTSRTGGLGTTSLMLRGLHIDGALFAGIICILLIGLAALFMASVGLYGVMSFSVSHRVSEMGVRMALGAQARQVTGLIIRQGLSQIAVGLFIGSGLAYLVARGLSMVLYQVDPWDPVTFGGVLLLLLITGVGASAIPAVRATKVDPMVALASE